MRKLILIDTLKNMSVRLFYSLYHPCFTSSSSEKLKKRVNRRLKKLAKWSDSSADDRQAEFRVYNRGYGSSRIYAPTFPQRAATLPPSNMTIGGLPSSKAPLTNSTTIGGTVVKPVSSSTVISANPSSSDLASRASSFPLLASALAEQQQRKGELLPSTSTNNATALNTVRQQLQSELQQKDSERDELIQQLQQELRESKQAVQSPSVPSKMEEDEVEPDKEEFHSEEDANKDTNEDVMDVVKNESVEVVENIPASLHAPLTDAISGVDLEK